MESALLILKEHSNENCFRYLCYRVISLFAVQRGSDFASYLNSTLSILLSFSAQQDVAHRSLSDG